MTLRAIAISRQLQHFLDWLTWSWNHSHAFPLLATGTALVLVALIGVKRQWNGILTALTAVAAAVCLCGALVVALLGNEFARGQERFNREVTHELQRKH